MATLSLTWKDLNLNEDGFNIYRSETPMDVNNMPSPIATVGPNVGSYDDTTGVVGTAYYYRVGAVRLGTEAVSAEIVTIAGIDANTVAIYQFDGDTTDVNGTYNGTWYGTESYVAGKFGQKASLSEEYIILPIDLLSPSASISLWVSIEGTPLESLTAIASISYNSDKVLILGVDHDNALIGVIPEANKSSLLSARTSYTIGVTYHVVVTSAGDFYLNGELKSTEIAFSEFYSDVNLGESIIGARRINNSYISGIYDIDQVRIFDRVLTASEVDYFYNET